MHQGIVQLHHVGTADIPADHLTKAMSGQDMESARRRLGLVVL